MKRRRTNTFLELLNPLRTINDRKIFIFHDKSIDGGANEGYLLIKDYCHSLVNSHPETFLYVENKFNLGIASQWFIAGFFSSLLVRFLVIDPCIIQL